MTTFREAMRDMTGPAVADDVPTGAPLLVGADVPLDSIGDGLYLKADGSVGGAMTVDSLTVSPADPDTVAVALRPSAGATDNATSLIEVYDDTGTLLGYWDAAGNFQALSAAGYRITVGVFNAGMQSPGGNLVRVEDSQVTITAGKLLLTSLPTSDPHVAGQLWNSSGVLHVSAGP